MERGFSFSKNIQTFIDNLWDAIYIVNTDREILYWNKAAEELTGYRAGHVLGRRCGTDLLAHHCDATILCEVACPLRQTIQDGQSRESQTSFTSKDGESVPVFIRTLPFHDENGAIIGAVEVFRKVGGADEAGELLRELKNLAQVDPLTRAARRHYGEEVLKKALSAYKATGMPFGVLLVDLDKFKDINDTHGHLAGDSLLAGVADIIIRNLRASDLLVRWGGDEFLVITVGANAASLGHLGNKLCGLVAERAWEFEEHLLPLTLSVGGAVPAQEDTETELIRRADRNMYASKQRGRNRCTIEALLGPGRCPESGGDGAAVG